LLKHPDFSQTIDRLRKQLPSLAASGYRGIGVPDCVRSGQEAAKQVLNL
jgi:protoporphyrinogen oxidase